MYCSNNYLSELDVSRNEVLTEIICYQNKISNLDLSNNIALKELICCENQLEYVDVTKNIMLKKLDCAINRLTSLGVSANSKLITLACGGNQLNALDVSKNTKLTDLNCSNNKLRDLDLSKNTKLKVLSCDYNYLTDLDVRKNIALKDFDDFMHQYRQLKRKAGNYPEININTMTKSEWDSIFEMIPWLESIEKTDPTEMFTDHCGKRIRPLKYVRYKSASVQLIGRAIKILKPFDWDNWDVGIDILKEQSFTGLDLQTTCKLLTILLYYKESTEESSPFGIPCQAHDLEDGRVLKLLKQLKINVEQE